MFTLKIKNFHKKIFYRLFDKPLPPLSITEKNNISNLRKNAKKVRNSFAVALWKNYQKELYEIIERDDPRNFMRWDVIKRVLGGGFSPIFIYELIYLRMNKLWGSLWKNAIVKSSINNWTYGHPIPFLFYPKATGHMIHHAYHLLQLNKYYNIDFASIKTVFEFGGGYGGLYNVIYNLGFRGNYIIYDLPEMSAIQLFYLSGLKQFVKWEEHICLSEQERKRIDNIVYLINNNIELDNLLNSIEHNEKSLFIATWSFSECPLELRESLLPKILEFEYILIAYQNSFQEIDNRTYFKNIMNDNNFSWIEKKIKHMTDSNYILGKNIQ